MKILTALSAAATLTSDHVVAETDVRRDATVEAVQRVMPCVVNVGTENVVESRDSFEDIFRQFFDPYHQRQQTQFSLGSGVIIDEEGYILTNLHVVQRSRRTQIKLADEAGGGEYEVVPIVGTAKTDVALLKIIPKRKGEKFKAVRFAKDDDLLVGETVLALGNPFGLGGSVSRGILSSKSRAMPKDNERLDIPNWLQTDASINPGNSGGPLVNLRGELIGLNVAIAAQGQGIGFAIPIKQVSEALAEIFTPETDARWFGAKISPAATPLLITAVKGGSPADKAGLRPGDQILKVNGSAPKGFMELNQWLRDKSRQNFLFTFQRGAQQQTASVELLPLEQLIRQKLGLDAQQLDNELASRFGLNASAGLIVAGIEKGGPADQARMTPGIVLTEINGKRVSDFLNAIESFSNLKKGDPVKLVMLVPQRRGNSLLGYQQVVVALKAR
ncbi:MAG: trypsin-like peptidase domain-containing protein [Verrucomicrobiota bacterium]